MGWILLGVLAACSGAGSPERGTVAVVGDDSDGGRAQSGRDASRSMLLDAGPRPDARSDSGTNLDAGWQAPDTASLDNDDNDDDAGEPFEVDTGPEPAFCAHEGRADAVREVFCKSRRPRLRSLADLDRALGVSFDEYPVLGYGGTVLLAHSTALSGDIVSELNPRAIVTAPGVFVAFSRGIQQVEIAAADYEHANNNFYLIHFEQACNAVEKGCTPGDLYTPRIESDWLSVRMEDDEDLKNTPADCRQCHQRGTDQALLLMREFDGPWTHFFAPESDDPSGFPEPTGSTLLRDYLIAKGDEPYANIPTDVLRTTVGITLQNLVHRPQPLLFDGSKILNERWPWQGDGYAETPARSKTWYADYEAFKRGEQLPMPYFAPRVSDPDKQARLTQAYQRYRAGDLDAAELPDFADIFPDDPQIRAEIGLQTEPSATPAQALVQACGPCHNDVLDQSISRARFNIALRRMSRGEIELAIARLQLPRQATGAMPPPGRRQIDPDNMQALIDYLKQQTRPAEDDALLEHAAQVGMAGEQRAP